MIGKRTLVILMSLCLFISIPLTTGCEWEDVESELQDAVCPDTPTEMNLCDYMPPEVCELLNSYL